MPLPLPLLHLHHISLVTGKLDESRAFYRDVLGFREIPRPAFNFGGAWLYNYGLQIHLIENPAPAEMSAEIDSRADHIAFAVDDVDAVERLLREHGVRYRVNMQANTTVKQLFFHDPDGHNIEVARYPA